MALVVAARLQGGDNLWPWLGFLLLVAALLVLDLKVLHRRAHEIGVREALWASVFWIGLGLLFMVPVYYLYEWLHQPGCVSGEGFGSLTGHEAVLNYLAGFLVEKSLSVDNLFVFLLIFSWFAVPRIHQHRVLYWGILGAMAMRAVFILAGVDLVRRFHWILIFFGVFLVWTGMKLVRRREGNYQPERNLALRLARRWLPFVPEYEDGHFFIRRDGKRAATLLFMVLVVVESTDVVFALDSIPAIFGITRDPYLIFTSNIFAILGLRALFFALAGMMRHFHLLKYGLAGILVFIGLKMVLEAGESVGLPRVDVPISVALAVIVGALGAAVAASLVVSARNEPDRPDGGDGPV